MPDSPSSPSFHGTLHGLLCNIVVDIVTAANLRVTTKNMTWEFLSCMEDSIFGNLWLEIPTMGPTAECLSSYFKAPTTFTRMVRDGNHSLINVGSYRITILGPVNWQVKRWLNCTYCSSMIPSVECQLFYTFSLWVCADCLHYQLPLHYLEGSLCPLKCNEITWQPLNRMSGVPFRLQIVHRSCEFATINQLELLWYLLACGVVTPTFEMNLVVMNTDTQVRSVYFLFNIPSYLEC